MITTPKLHRLGIELEFVYKLMSSTMILLSKNISNFMPISKEFLLLKSNSKLIKLSISAELLNKSIRRLRNYQEVIREKPVLHVLQLEIPI